jgi:hypothetical protein
MLLNKLYSDYGVLLLLCVGHEEGEGGHKKNDGSANFIGRPEKSLLLLKNCCRFLSSFTAIWPLRWPALSAMAKFICD